MNEILDLIQKTLDYLLVGGDKPVYSFWGRRAEIANDQATEYIIYSIESDDADVSADGLVYFRMMEVSLQYYVKSVLTMSSILILQPTLQSWKKVQNCSNVSTDLQKATSQFVSQY